MIYLSNCLIVYTSKMVKLSWNSRATTPMEKAPKIGWVYRTHPLFKGDTMGLSAQIFWTSSNCPRKCLILVGNKWILKPRVLKHPPCFMFLIISIVILSTWKFLTFVSMILAGLLWVFWCKCRSHSEIKMKLLKKKHLSGSSFQKENT